MTEDVIYDIEVLPNVFTCAVVRVSDGKVWTFEVSPRKNEVGKFRKFINLLRMKNYRMVGFNNVHYDYPVIHYLMTDLTKATGAKSITNALFKRSKDVIASGNLPGLGRFKYNVWEKNHIVTQIDLFKIHHFDNKAKQTSLKRLQFNMRLKSIKEFEIAFDKPIKTAKELDSLMEYNIHDTMTTLDFYNMSKGAIDFREEMGRQLNCNMLNFNDPKIGEEYLTIQLRDRVGEHVLKDEDGKKLGTKRGIIPVKDIIFDYIKFDNSEFKRVLNQLKTFNMHIVNGKFQWNERDDFRKGLLAIEGQAKIVKQMKSMVGHVGDIHIDEAQEKLNAMTEKWNDHDVTAVVDGFEFDLGKGGLHGARGNSVYRSNETHLIVDIDVEGMYPRLGIVNNLYPEHLTSAFVPIYGELPKKRAQYAKGSNENALFKLAQNGTYGKTNSEFSVFYDPKYTVSTTINGQLLLCMLWEKLREIKDIEIIQANTDGITFYINRKYIKQAGQLCREWQDLTGMQLEQATYNQMITRDVNNYICEYKGGGIKAKGAYRYDSLYHEHGMDTKGIEWHKNHNAVVVTKAAHAYLLKGQSIEKFIVEHTDIYDFFLCTNINRSCQLLLGDEPYQRNSRYIISKGGEKLIKLMPPLPKNGPDAPIRRIGINANYTAEIYNVIESEKIGDYDINFQFYIDEAKKLIKPFEGKV